MRGAAENTTTTMDPAGDGEASTARSEKRCVANRLRRLVRTASLVSVWPGVRSVRAASLFSSTGASPRKDSDAIPVP